MLEIFGLAAPIYVLIAAGFIMVKTGYIAQTNLPALSQFVLKICIPVLIFMALHEPGALNALNWKFLFGYSLAAFLVAGIIAGIMIRVFGKRLDLGLILGLGSASSNSAFLGLPMASIVFGDQAFQVFAWILIAENLIVTPLMVAFADSARSGSTTFAGSLRNVLTSVAKSPLMVGLVLGLVASVLEFQPPKAMLIPLEMIRTAGPALSLMVVGGFVATQRLSNLGPEVGLITFAKLGLHPAVTFLVLWALPGLGFDLVLAGMVFACVPMFTIFTILAGKHGGETIASAAMILTTAGSVLSCTLMLLLAARLL